MIALAVLVMLAQAPPPSGPNPYLDQAKKNYAEVQYERCVERLRQAVRWPSTRAEQLEIELYAGLCQFNLGRTAAAQERFEMALKLDRTAQLPPYSPPKAVALFEQVSRTAPTPGDAPLVDDGKPPPGPELTPPATPPEPRAPALVEAPHNQNWAPLALGGGALVVGGVAVGLNLLAQSQARDANAERFESLAIEKGNRARATATGSYVLFGVAAAAAVGALVTWLLRDDGPVTSSPSSSP
ncbi:MAG: hypothetical protein K1X89_22575 [Myxococcaceae bacterium]|nr:hypothetical protein [Myxococcaceae bacterium]